MNRLRAELQRLYLSTGEAQSGARAMVLALGGPGAWEHLSQAWRGVQVDLALPAPGIAVSGGDGYQLWFSVAQPVPAVDARAFLDAVRKAYLGGLSPDRVRMRVLEAASDAQQPDAMPPTELAPGQWSAFVAPDLAPLFAQEPWLDIPPGVDAQADLLARLDSMQAADLQKALALAASKPQATAAPGSRGPRAFLLEVMNDPAVALQLRIEAAKALLPWFEGRQP